MLVLAQIYTIDSKYYSIHYYCVVNMKEIKIDISPHRSIMQKIAQTGYSLPDALSELIDNSIDARTSEHLTIKIDITPNYILVQDNGVGMGQNTAAQAMCLGFSSKKEKLGEFGLGLKTSALSLGDAFNIITAQEHTNEAYHVTFDLHEWMQNGDWKQHPMHIKPKLRNGTSITIAKLKTLFTDYDIKQLIKHLGLRFGPFINEGVSITVNGVPCEPFVSKPDQKSPIELQLSSGVVVKGWFGYQLAGDLKHYYGFNTYRRNRLISTFDKIGLTQNQRSKQIIGELHIEGIPVTHDKRGWVRESDQFRELKSKLKSILRKHDKPRQVLVKGTPAHPGIVEGIVKFVDSFSGYNDLKKVNKGDIVVTQMTRPHMLAVLRKAGAVVTNLGGALSHAAIVGREFGIPTIVGTQDASTVLQDGMKVVVDSEEGVVYAAD